MNVAKLLGGYDRIDRALVAAGFHPTSPWWRKQIERFIRAGRRRWIIRAGRRAGKSSTLCRLAVAVALFGAWSVPPGDVAVIPFVSVSSAEASGRLRTIRAILTTLGVRFDERGDEIEVELRNRDRDRRLVFRVVACSIKGTVGFTSVAVFADEMARWESRDNAANPAREVMASLRPTMATQAHAFEVCSSSPWGVDDLHAKLFDEGDNEHQVISYAPTWVANPDPTVAEERTRELEPDPRIWAREYLAEPGVTLTAALDPEDVAACYDREPVGKPVRGFCAIDASSLRGDAFTYLCGRETTEQELKIGEVSGWSGDDLRRVSLATVAEHISERAKAWEARIVWGDQREEAGLRVLFAEHSTHFESFAWSEPSKDTAVMLLRRLMRERRLFLPPHEALRQQLLTMKARLLPSGRTRYETNGLDYASALITLMHAACERKILKTIGNEFSRALAANERLWRGSTRDGLGLNEPQLPHRTTQAGTRFGNVPGRGFG
jgi:hypothetical protein